MVVLEGSGHVRLGATLGVARATPPSCSCPISEAGVRLSRRTRSLALDGFTARRRSARAGDSRCDSLPSFTALTADQRDHIPDDIATAAHLRSAQDSRRQDRGDREAPRAPTSNTRCTI
jgi:hypothetical protein